MQILFLSIVGWVFFSLLLPTFSHHVRSHICMQVPPAKNDLLLNVVVHTINGMLATSATPNIPELRVARNYFDMSLNNINAW